ncbi:TPA: hypothetical protein JBI36_06505 [Legionella pneumophila]|nr:hypothetical protein [Legionella pneumophila]
MFRIRKKYNQNLITISEEEAAILKETSEKLRLALSFERNFEYLIQNYLDYENTIAQKSIGQLVNGPQSMDEFDSHITDVTIKLLNLLSTTKAYIDKSPSILKKLMGEADLFKIECSLQYDTNFSYRFIDSLRNYAQHNNDPLSSLILGGEWVENEDLKYYTNPLIDTKALRANKKFRKSVLPEYDVKFHLSYCIRRYIESLSLIHKKMSSSFKADLDTLCDKSKNILFEKDFKLEEEFIFLYENGEYQSICLKMDKYLKFNKKHSRLSNISNHCVSTCVKNQEKKVIKDLDKIPFNSTEAEKKYFISMRSNHGEAIASDLELNTLPEDCKNYFKSLINN